MHWNKKEDEIDEKAIGIRCSLGQHCSEDLMVFMYSVIIEVQPHLPLLPDAQPYQHAKCQFR